MLSRRGFLVASSAPYLSAQAPLKKIAMILTEYRENAHADVICTRLLEGYEYYGKQQTPRVQTVAMYVDQVPANDMSRDKAAKHKVPIFKTVREALTLGGDKLAVDGVVLVGEHGTYPTNEKGQHLYPRYELYSQVMEVFESSKRSVPVFCDKHLSVDWWKAKWMVDQSKKLNFPLLAGSSVPIAWRRPQLELAMGSPVKHAVAAAGGPLEAYGYHAMEAMQAMVERRKGGETGISSVQTLKGEAVWKWTDDNAWALPLLTAACGRSETLKPGGMRMNCKDPFVFLLSYKDGLECAVYMLNGHLGDFTFAAEVGGQQEPVSTLFWLQPARFYSHFSTLVHYIEETIVNRRTPYPVERTLLVTGALAAGMDSAFQKGEKLNTPYLEFKYAAPKESLYNQGAVPPLEQKR